VAEPVLAAVGAAVPAPILEPPPLVDPIVAAPSGNSADEVFGEVLNSLPSMPPAEPPAIQIEPAKEPLSSVAYPQEAKEDLSAVANPQAAEEDVPLIEPPALDLPDEPAPQSLVEAVPEPPPDASDGVVEFIELIPLEIEELPPADSTGT